MTLFKAVKKGMLLSSALATLAAVGCTSVEKTPIEELLAVQTTLPVTKPGEYIEGLPSADQIASAAQDQVLTQQDTETSQKVIAAAATEAVQSEGPTVELASVVKNPNAALAASAAPVATSQAQALSYAPPLPAAADALAAQTAAGKTSGTAPVQLASIGGLNDGFDTSAPVAMTVAVAPGTAPSHINALISKYAALYGVPESLVHRVAKRESTYNPKALHRGNYGLMQIRYNTARGLGYDGTPTGLLDAETNLKYAVKYLRGAWLVADKDEKAADWLYRTGYYYDAKRKGMLDQIR